MRRRLCYNFNTFQENIIWKAIGLFTILGGFNIATWCWAFSAFHFSPSLLSTAFVAYSLGLRHAVDADHIAAIDNVTRKLMQDGKQPLAVGLFFSLGHSSVVVLASLLVSATATTFAQKLHIIQKFGAIIGPMTSIIFLFSVAIINIVIFYNLYQNFCRAKSSNIFCQEDIHTFLSNGGLLTRFLKPLFGLIHKSWHMYPLGFLFGLGFDTATEVGLLSLSATQASHGMPFYFILVFPALFTAGMSLVDTLDSILMLGAYGWAFVKPIRKFYYNMTLTAVSIIVALLISSIEGFELLRNHLSPKYALWNWTETLSENFGILGCVIIAIFMTCWFVSVVITNHKRI
ncbi:HoxN/HupN/NixA family nickel/cobalt transporter [Acetobacter pasteurianus]|uniref:Nickel/cobalt efflux system n=1 Tax=Acetobacter pasteurianus NBRC 3188 TaxID=1226663 RepID=A0A401WW91_ACEPA|nr:HoxN/HupN/NixA family nickel/cobalt transporter [Acetobacter pasteurianus]GCD53544.1 high-affinity nickel-transporter [Acetobacter pasteurianus NBRC 3188]